MIVTEERRPPRVPEQAVATGQTMLAYAPRRLTAVLGSCVAVALFHPRHRVGAVAHVMHADSAGRDGAPGRFADTAVPYLLELLRNEGIGPDGLIVRIAGGASMFAEASPDQIGAHNIAAVRAALDLAGLRIAAEHTAGNGQRRITLDCQTGELRIEADGLPAALI